MRIAQPLIAVAVGAALAGLAAWTSLRHGVSSIDVQAHLTLLGWLSLAAYGFYYCVPGPVRRPRLAVSQAAAAILGFLAMTGGTAALDMTGDPRFAAVAGAGVLLAAVGLVLFLAQLLPAGRRHA